MIDEPDDTERVRARFEEHQREFNTWRDTPISLDWNPISRIYTDPTMQRWWTAFHRGWIEDAEAQSPWCHCESPGPHFHPGARGKFCAVCGKDMKPKTIQEEVRP